MNQLPMAVLLPDGGQLGAAAAAKWHEINAKPQNQWTQREYEFVAHLQNVQQQKNPQSHP